ncbi:AAA family ATPase [Actinokineospora auranticolor]|nr:LuxR family transcriptional regulator [Actinokineospora auranticolor]
MPRLGSGIPLVARGRELRRLRTALEGAAAGRASAVLLAGDAGIGKTRMTEEIGVIARDLGARVLTGRCLDAGETGLPYLPVAEALAQVREHAQSRPALGRLFPEVALPASPEPGGQVAAIATSVWGTRAEQDIGQLQLFDAVHGLLNDLAERAPLLLVLEDLHWADASTRSLLSFLLSRLRSQRMLVLGTYRSDDLHRRHPLRPLLAELVRLPQVERIELAPFGTADARAFVTALAEERLPEPVLREVAGRSEGNAFFAEELLAAYSMSDSVGIPANLVDVLLARVERLNPATQGVVRIASVAGRRVRDAQLRAVADLEDGDLETALREAVAHHVLVPGDGEHYAFRHALLREAVYTDLLPGERVRLHAAYARVLATDSDSRGVAAALAHHSMESHALPAALAASVAATWEAERLGAPAESLDHAERALKLWNAVPADQRPTKVDELTLLRHASWVAGMSGDPERAVAFAKSAVAAAKAAGDTVTPERAATLHRRLAEAMYYIDGREEEAMAAVEQAWAMLADRPDSSDQAWVLTAYATILRSVGRLEESRLHARRALDVARRVGARGPEVDALATLAVLDEADGQAVEARQRLAEVIPRAGEIGAISTELRARYFLCVNLYESGLLDQAAGVVDAGVERARATGLTWSAYGTELRVIQVVIRYVRGDWDGAEAAAEPPGHRVSSTVSARLASVGANIAVARGRFAEAERLVTELRSDWHRDIQIPLVAGGVAAELAAWRGRPDRAVDGVREALDWIAQAGEQWMMATIRLAAHGIAAHADLATTARRAGHPVDAHVAEGERLMSLARQTAANGRPRTGTLGPEGRAWLARGEAELTRLHGPAADTAAPSASSAPAGPLAATTPAADGGTTNDPRSPRPDTPGTSTRASHTQAIAPLESGTPASTGSAVTGLPETDGSTTGGPGRAAPVAGAVAALTRDPGGATVDTGDATLLGGPDGSGTAEAHLDRPDVEAWQRAVAAFGYGAVYEQALCRRRLAEALLGRDDRDPAAEQLRLADEVATRLAAKPLSDALRRTARRARIALGDAVVVRDEVDPFTPRERAVLTLVAAGRTNRQVGEELFISEKTVSVHLSRIMAKLGASRRAEAVAVAYDRGLLSEASGQR